MMKIFKYWVRDGVALIIPRSARILSLQFQEGRAMVWAMVDTIPGEVVFLNRMVRVYGTGVDCGGAYHMDYLGTLQDRHGFVWHYFIEKEK